MVAVPEPERLPTVLLPPRIPSTYQSTEVVVVPVTQEVTPTPVPAATVADEGLRVTATAAASGAPAARESTMEAARNGALARDRFQGEPLVDLNAGTKVSYRLSVPDRRTVRFPRMGFPDNSRTAECRRNRMWVVVGDPFSQTELLRGTDNPSIDLHPENQ